MAQQNRLQIRQVLQLGRALRLVWQSSPGWTSANLVLLVVQAVLPVASLYLTKLLVDGVSSGLLLPDKSSALATVLPLLGLLGLTALAAAACRALSGWVSEAQTQVVTDYLHGIVHRKAAAVDFAYYENARYYDTLHRALQEAPFRPARIIAGLVQLGQSVFSLLAVALLLLTLHWGTALLLLAAVLPGTLVRLRYAETLFRWQRLRTPRERRAWYFNGMLTGDSHAKEIRLFDLAEAFEQRYCELRAELRRERLQLASKQALADFATQAGAAVAILACLGYIALRTLQGGLTLGDLFMYFQAFQRAQTYLQEALGSLVRLYEDNLFLSYLYEFLDLPNHVAEPAEPVSLPLPLQSGIRFENVSFCYPDSKESALDHIDLTIAPGQIVAFVGENGSGKTTLVKLLCRLYDPSAGRITVDGIDLRDLSLRTWRQTVSAIFQDFARYHLSAAENIAPAHAEESEPIARAAQASGAHEVIAQLRDGYQTLLGRWFDQGEELSVGQWQKVALARAFWRDCPVLILDEPTSAIDAAAEDEIFEKFQLLAARRTTVLISHRLSTVKLADRIYVLAQGRIVEQGSHDELIARQGTYARLFELQAQHYR
ncbi:ABC transporter ATP-binding protein [Gloeobacter kilaueensis]|uniref:ABC transporter n=1 Tax=Gloeobacter kilaueensis (strain ATCC BAA-2537 / CCAP 1431/1 / ULC 316 / JS1) TaxID=1183438 RepID=U5QN15_GLOK1|nr:ABC transporter ATP-binding protein [Gloeobacter kilaueensis]AGY59070.1 ABC transporter [Gloeobacter kilaueensis JS1]